MLEINLAKLYELKIYTDVRKMTVP